MQPCILRGLFASQRPKEGATTTVKVLFPPPPHTNAETLLCGPLWALLHNFIIRLRAHTLSAVKISHSNLGRAFLEWTGQGAACVVRRGRLSPLDDTHQ